MMYAVKKFRHYLFENQFTIFMDHQALLHLINNPCNTGRIILLVHGTTQPKGKPPFIILHGEAPTNIDDDFLDSYLFNKEIVEVE